MFRSVSLGLTWFHLVSLGFAWFHLVSLGFTWFLLVSLGFTWSHLVSLGFTWFHLVSHGFTWFHLFSLGVTCVTIVLLGFTWFHLDSLGFTGQGEKGKHGVPKREKGKRPRSKLGLDLTRQPERAHARTIRNDFLVGLTPPTSHHAQGYPCNSLDLILQMSI